MEIIIIIILRKHFDILLSSKRCREVFKHPPIVAYRRTSNLRDILVKAKLPAITTTNNTSLPPGSFRCGQDCATCPCITGVTRQIKSHITCNTKYLIYMIQCNRCSLQYIGETKRRLKDRFNEHRRSVDKTNTKSKPTTVAKHFLSHRNHAILTCN